MFSHLSRYFYISGSKEFDVIVDGLSDALDFSQTIGIDSSPPYEQGGGRGALRDVDFYTRYTLLFIFPFDIPFVDLP